MDLVDRHPLKEKRRANKPLLERKRRARINDSLTDLKHLVLTSLNKDASKYTKMEKVDILDMTVQFLKGRTFEKRKDDYVSVYRAGYSECTKEMYQSIMTMEGLDHALKCRILTNIAANLPEHKMTSPPPSPTLSSSSRSPVHSPIGPDKKCVSSLFTPTTRCILPTTFQAPTNITNECPLNFHPLSTVSKNVIRSNSEHFNMNLQYKNNCMDHRLYCHGNVATNPTKRATVGKEVWRPW